jgi:tellurite methyltransferase
MTTKAEYEQIYREDPAAFGREAHKVILKLAKRLSPQSTVLDLGAGQGRNALFLAGKGHHVTALELTETGCQQMQVRAKQEGLSLDACIQGDIGDASVLEQFGSYDAIVCVGVFPFLDHQAVERVLAAMKEKTNPKGYIAISARRRGMHHFLPGELRERFRDMIVHFYEEVLSRGYRDGKLQYSARIVAQK